MKAEGENVKVKKKKFNFLFILVVKAKDLKEWKRSGVTLWKGFIHKWY